MRTSRTRSKGSDKERLQVFRLQVATKRAGVINLQLATCQPATFLSDTIPRMLPGPILLIVSAYVIGSIPFSFLVVRMFAGADIRKHGSGNVGATNVMRNFGKWPGLLALVLDIAKGFLAIVVARRIVAQFITSFPVHLGDPSSHSQPSFWIGLAALVAVLGHIFPLWLKFRGGKGVATATGVFLAIDPRTILMSMIVFAIVILATRYVSLASMLAAAAIPLLMRFATNQLFWIVIFSIVIAVIIILKHHSNIARLSRGEERKLGQRREL